MATVLVCGSREWTDRDRIRFWLKKLPSGCTVVHGDNGIVDPKTGTAVRGADKIAGEVAAELGFKVRPFPADWDRHGDAAGPIRNQQMIDVMQPRRVVAFILTLMRRNGSVSKPAGSTDCLTRALAAGIPCTLVPGTRPTRA